MGSPWAARGEGRGGGEAGSALPGVKGRGRKAGSLPAEAGAGEDFKPERAGWRAVSDGILGARRGPAGVRLSAAQQGASRRAL